MCKQGFVTEGRQPGFIPARAKPLAHMCSPLLAPARVNQRASIHGPKSVCLRELATAPCLQSGVLWIFVNIGTAPAPLTSSGGAAPPWPPKFSLVLFAHPLFLTLVPVFDPTVVLCWLSLPALRVVLHESLCSDSQLLASSVIAAMSLPLTNELASCCLYTRRQAIRPPFLVPVHLPLQQDEPRSPASLPHFCQLKLYPVTQIYAKEEQQTSEFRTSARIHPQETNPEDDVAANNRPSNLSRTRHQHLTSPHLGTCA